MTAFFATIDLLLRGQGEFAAGRAHGATASSGVRAQVRIIVTCGATYGAIMGSLSGATLHGAQQMLLSAIKVPFLFLVAFVLCVPSFFVMNALSGLRDDFPLVLRAILAFQSTAAIVLAALSPITLLMNLSTGFYEFMLLWNGLMFLVASVSGHLIMRKAYRQLIALRPLHRNMLRVWMTLYTFVGIQMGWVLRPFIGAPGLPVQIFRESAWGNAYLEIATTILRGLGK